MHYGMAMLAAELRPDVANMMALRLTDKTAERGKEYEYIVQPTVMDTTGHLPIMSGHVESIKNERYTPEPFAPEMGDSAVAHCSTRIWWEDLGRYIFSSRRRHTRSLCDWSSDVCSSDLSVRRSAIMLATSGRSSAASIAIP